MDYDVFEGMDDVEYLYKTGRGSTYAHTTGSKTVRNRSGEGHTDKTTGIQPKSGKTVYMDKEAVSRIGPVFQNAEMATKFVPEMDKQGRPTGKANLVLMEDYGPRKAGSVIASGDYTTTPKKGMHPVEIYRSDSPMGSRGSGIHFGSAITEVRSAARTGKRGLGFMPDPLGKAPLPTRRMAEGGSVMANVDLGLLTQAVEKVESGGRRYDSSGKLLTSSKGAQGEMQVMPATARDPGFGVIPAQSDSPDELARVGRDYLSALVDKYDNVEHALVAYN